MTPSELFQIRLGFGCAAWAAHGCSHPISTIARFFHIVLPAEHLNWESLFSTFSDVVLSSESAKRKAPAADVLEEKNDDESSSSKIKKIIGGFNCIDLRYISPHFRHGPVFIMFFSGNRNRSGSCQCVMDGFIFLLSNVILCTEYIYC